MSSRTARIPRQPQTSRYGRPAKTRSAPPAETQPGSRSDEPRPPPPALLSARKLPELHTSVVSRYTCGMGHRVSIYLTDEAWDAWKAEGVPLGELVRRGISAAEPELEATLSECSARSWPRPRMPHLAALVPQRYYRRRVPQTAVLPQRYRTHSPRRVPQMAVHPRRRQLRHPAALSRALSHQRQLLSSPRCPIFPYPSRSPQHCRGPGDVRTRARASLAATAPSASGGCCLAAPGPELD